MMRKCVDTFWWLLLGSATLWCMLRPAEVAQQPAPPAEPPRPKRARLLFAGDLMQHAPQIAAARNADGTFDFRPSFELVAPLLREADLAVVNLETSLASTPPYTGYPLFRTPAPLADALAWAGIDAVTAANNHCCDGGARGIAVTLDTLRARGIRHTGLFADSADYRLNHPLYLDAGDMRLALLSYTFSTNGLPVPPPALVNRIDTTAMAAAIAGIDRDSTDCIVAALHWGDEYRREPSPQQRAVADFLRRHGADIVIGSHPHVVQPIEIEGGMLTVYSLGNFVSNQRRRYRDGGLMVEIELCKRQNRPLEILCRAIPVWVLCPGYRIVPVTAADTVAMTADQRAACERFFEDTYGLLGGATTYRTARPDAPAQLLP